MISISFSYQNGAIYINPIEIYFSDGLSHKTELISSKQISAWKHESHKKLLCYCVEPNHDHNNTRNITKNHFR